MLRVDEANRGKMARCPKCSMINSIPAATVAEPLNLPAKDPQLPPTTYLPPDEELWSMRGVDGTIYGPIRLGELRRWHDEGRINYQCAVQRVGDAQWQPALDVLAPVRAAKPEMPFTPMTESPNYVGRQFRPHNGTMIIVLACIGTLVFPCAVVAAIMGHYELKQIKRGIVDPAGESMVRAGYVIGLIFAILGLLPLFCCCVFPAFTGVPRRF